MRKKSLIMGATACWLALSLTACGGNASADSVTDADTKPEPEEIRVVKIVSGGNADSEACRRVAEEASEITREKLGIEIELVRLNFGSFKQEVNLMLSSGEKVDLIPNFTMPVAMSANSGQILPLDALLKDYGQDILTQVSDDDFGACTVNGEIFSVPNNKEKAVGYGYIMRKDMLDATDISVADIKTEDDLEAVFERIMDLYPDTYPLVSDKGDMGYPMCYQDSLGGDYGVLEDGMDYDNITVVNWYETATYQTMMEQRYVWAQKGYIIPDASARTEAASELIGAGKGFSYLTNTKPGIANEWSRKAGTEMVVVHMVDPMATTAGLTNQWYIPHSSTEPEAAMQVLNEMYINKELANLLINGIEGEHYVMADAAAGIIDYPEGVTASTTTYAPTAWLWPNEFISYPWKADGANIWTETIAFNQAAKKSLGLGFVWNNEAVLNEITACNNVADKYKKALNCGAIEPAEGIAKMVKELKDAGVDRIVEEKQRQFDAWLLSKDAN